MNYITEYWKEIEGGKCVVSRRVRKVYEQLARRIEQPEAGGRYIFDEKKALRPIEFIERFCKHSKGEWAGKPVTLELFQKAFISALFGFVDKETGLRQYREAMFYVARKNGKSTMLAGIALYMLVADLEAGAEIYSAATKRDQARLIFEEAYNMVKQSAQLRELLKKRKGDLYFAATFSRFEALSKRRCSLQPEQSVEKSGRYFRGYGEGQRSGIRYNRKGIQAAGSCNTGVQRPERICRYPFVLLQGAGGRNAATRGRAGNDVGRSKLPDRQRVKNRNSLAK